MPPKADTANKDTAEVVYTPLDPGDGHETTFAGIRFKANVATAVPLSLTYPVTVREEVKAPDGMVHTRGVERRRSAVEALRDNPHFKVDGKQAPRPDDLKARVPDTPEQWRAYAIGWINVSTNAKAMDTRWDGEATLRERCGCSGDDIRYVRPFFDARRAECADIGRAA
jgi:hypothetical protein